MCIRAGFTGGQQIRFAVTRLLRRQNANYGGMNAPALAGMELTAKLLVWANCRSPQQIWPLHAGRRGLGLRDGRCGAGGVDWG